MIIGIDGNEANLAIRVGVGQYAFNLIRKIYELDKKNSYLIYLKEKPLNDMPKERENWQYVVFGPKKMWTKIALPIKLFFQKEKLSLFFSPSHYSPHWCSCPTVPTIHDLGYLKYNSQFTKKDLYQLINWTKRSIKRANKIVAVSEFTKHSIIETYGVNQEKIKVAYNGVELPTKIDRKNIDKILKKFGINKKYFLYLGTLKPSKNIPFLIRALKKYQGDEMLVIAGKKGWLFEEIFKTVTDCNLQDRVVFTDYITEEEKWALYLAAEATVIPSVYEGFGIPAIESMICGTPVIVSDIPPFREVVGKYGLFINPHNLDDLAEKMGKINRSLAVGAKKHAEKFSWENTAKSVLEVFKMFNN